MGTPPPKPREGPRTRNVAVLAYTDYPADPRVRREAEALARQGYHVDAIVLRPERSQNDPEPSEVAQHEIPIAIARGSRVRYVFQYTLFSLISGFVLFRLHLKRRFDVVHVHSLPDFLVFCALPEKLLGARVVLDLHEAMPEILAARFHLSMSNLLVLIAKAIEWMSASFADRIISVSEIRADLIAQRGISRSKVSVVPNSPDTSSDVLYAGEPVRIDQMPSQRWVIVEAGGINPERDLETVVRAAGLLSRVHPVSLILFGKGVAEYTDRLTGIALREAPEVDFKVSGWIPPSEVPRQLAISCVGIASYERNPLTEFAAPNKVFEFVAAQKPLVLADLKALRHEWADAALFYEPGNAEDLARKVRRIIEDPVLASSLVLKANEIYKRNDWKTSKQTLLRLFESITAATGE